MPEISECYAIASKIPKLGAIKELEVTSKFNIDINKKKNIKKDLLNSIIHKPFAYGKSIWFPIEKNDKFGYLISQLGMTGSWSVNKSLVQRDHKHNHLIIKGKSKTLIYNDPRRFGKMNLYWGTDWESLKSEIIKENKWGLDPFISSENDLVESLIIGWRNRKQEIKKLLLEQKLIFGIGNYLASEILFKSKLNPHLRPPELNETDYLKIVSSIKFIIERSLKAGGFSFAGGYLLPDGTYGNYASKVLIYGKAACPVCKQNTTKDYIESRITYWCENCQKK